MSVVRLTHFTDPHLYGERDESLRGVATLPALTAALAHARARDWPPDAVLVTGDLVQDDPAGYPHFRRLFGSLGLPVLCLPGNHDEPRAMRARAGRQAVRARRLRRHRDAGASCCSTAASPARPAGR